MIGAEWVDGNFWACLVAVDEETARVVRVQGCRACGGRLDRADFPRKPREGELVAVGESFARRISFCCAREGCRVRSTPPSVRFLGRRVYLAVVVLLTCLQRLSAGLRRATSCGVAPRTVCRWQQWWRDGLSRHVLFAVLAARFVPPLDVEQLPTSLWTRFGGPMPQRAIMVLRWLAPWTTTSVAIRDLVL